MRKYYILIAFIFSTLFYGQDNQKLEVMRYYYQTKILVDISESKVLREGVAIIDLFVDKSRFMDLAYYERSEKNMIKESNISNEELIQRAISNRPVFTWFVLTDKANNVFYNKIGRLHNFYIEDRNEIKWVIQPHKLKWNEYEIQEATTSYGGREWTVWFTQDIPNQVGPYKFNNLPGFVVKAWDSEEHYVFEFLNSQKINVLSEIDGFEVYEESSKAKTKKAMNINSNQTFYSELEGTGITLDAKGQELMNRKKGNHINPIERDY